MAQTQLLHQQCSFSDLLVSQQGFSRSQLALQYPTPTVIPSHRDGEYTGPYVMAQPLLQRQYKSENSTQDWTAPQQLSEGFQPPVSTAIDTTSNNFGYPPGQLWSGTTALNDSSAFKNAIHTEPYIVQDMDAQVRQNCNLAYDQGAALYLPVKDHGNYGRRPDWVPMHSHGLPRDIGINGFDMEVNNSLSPTSPFSDRLDNTYSPGSMSDTASPTGTWSSHCALPMSYSESSPQYASAQTHTGLTRTYSSQGLVPFHYTDFSGVGHDMASSSPTPNGSSRQIHGALSLDNRQQTTSEYSCSQGNNSSSSSWHPAGRSNNTMYIPHRPCIPQAQFGSDASVPAVNEDGPSACPSSERDSSRNDMHARITFQPRFQEARTVDTETQRKSNDDLLVQGKKSGMTYKEIRNRMVGEKPAESTLRGRYRSLTKARKDRVRKPIWKKNDITLLNQFVESELERIESSLSNPHAPTIHQKLVKVRWKEVAEYIKNHGGSYRFGNSTCKKEWLKRHPDIK